MAPVDRPYRQSCQFNHYFVEDSCTRCLFPPGWIQRSSLDGHLELVLSVADPGYSEKKWLDLGAVCSSIWKPWH